MVWLVLKLVHLTPTLSCPCVITSTRVSQAKSIDTYGLLLPSHCFHFTRRRFLTLCKENKNLSVKHNQGVSVILGRVGF